MPVWFSPQVISATSSGATSGGRDRKSTRLNSSHSQISYAVFCLKKKKILDEPQFRKPPRPRRYVSPPEPANGLALVRDRASFRSSQGSLMRALFRLIDTTAPPLH